MALQGFIVTISVMYASYIVIAALRSVIIVCGSGDGGMPEHGRFSISSTDAEK